MPELPEVENVRLSLTSQGLIGQRLARVELLRADLRRPFPPALARKLAGQSVTGIHRRAKYILFETEKFFVLSHLGMTGSWRPLVRSEKHDHVILHFDSGMKLVFNDPRRFGLLDLVVKEKLQQSRWLKHLGVEPLSDEFNADGLYRATRGIKAPIKNFLMDQRRVVGVGNIYASEALFAARVRPSRPAGRLKATEAAALVENVVRILRQAIADGGSTIRDYRNADGRAGAFQERFLVYDRGRGTLPNLPESHSQPLSRGPQHLLVPAMPGLIVLAYASLLVQSLLDNARGPFFPDIMADLHLTGTTGSAFFAVMNLFCFAGSWISPYWLKGRSARNLLRVANALIGFGFMAVALSPNYPLLLAGCAWFGAAFGILNVAQNVSIYEASSREKRRRYFSGLHSMYALASLFAPLLASLFRLGGLSWRTSFLLLGAAPVVLAGFGRDGSRSRPAVVNNSAGLIASEWTTLLLFSLLLAAYLWGEVSLSSRLVLWLRQDLHFSPERADLYLSGFFLTFFIGRATFGVVHFKGVSNWQILWLSAGFSALTYALALTVSPLWVLAAGLGVAPFYPVAMEQISALFHSKSAPALSFAIAFGSLSTVVMHVVIGVASDRFGVGRALSVGPLCLFLVFTALTVRQAWSFRTNSTKR